MLNIKSHLNKTVKKCVENTVFMHIAASYKKLTDINLLKSMKMNEINRLSSERIEVQSALDVIETKQTNKLHNNRKPLIERINEIDGEIDEIEQLLANLDIEKQNIQYEIVLLSQVKS